MQKWIVSVTWELKKTKTKKKQVKQWKGIFYIYEIIFFGYGYRVLVYVILFFFVYVQADPRLTPYRILCFGINTMCVFSDWTTCKYDSTVWHMRALCSVTARVHMGRTNSLDINDCMSASHRHLVWVTLFSCYKFFLENLPSIAQLDMDVQLAS